MVVQICQYMTHMATLCDFACSSDICLIWRPGTVQGTVINVSSGASRVPMPHNQRYGVAKAAQDALTKALAFEFAPKGVRINAILPGELSAFVSADIMPDDTGCRLHSYTLARTTSASDCFLSVTNVGSRCLALLLGCVEGVGCLHVHCCLMVHAHITGLACTRCLTVHAHITGIACTSCLMGHADSSRLTCRSCPEKLSICPVH